MFTFRHHKDEINIYNHDTGEGVTLTLEEFQKYIPKYSLPTDNIIERSYSQYTEGDYVFSHLLKDKSGKVYGQDDWEYIEEVKSLLPEIIQNKETDRQRVIDLIKEQIKKREEFNNSLIPLGNKILQDLHKENLLTVLINKGNVRYLIGLLIYTLFIPDEDLALKYLQHTVTKSNTIFTAQMDSIEIKNIIDTISRSIQ